MYNSKQQIPNPPLVREGGNPARRDWSCYQVPPPGPQPDDMYERSELRQHLRRAMASLGGRDHRILLLRYADDLTLKQIGLLLGISQCRVSQIHKRALQRMANQLHPRIAESPHVLMRPGRLCQPRAS